MKTQFLLALCAPLLFAGCREQSVTNKVPTTPLTVKKSAPANVPVESTDAPSLTPAPTSVAVKTATYRVRGQVTEVPEPSNGAAFLVVRHEDIPGFMPAMQMRLPLLDGADAQKVKPGDKIAFDMNRDNIKISNIEKLPPSTTLKLEK